jgi:MFS family permease
MALAAVLGIGECLHGAVQAPLATDLADERLMGRYMAVSAFSWSAGFAIGPAIGGFMLGESATALWVGAGLVCFAVAGSTFALERVLPDHVRRTPATTPVAAGD